MRILVTGVKGQLGYDVVNEMEKRGPMTYQVHITKTAERDLISAADHIEFVLKNPKAADDLLDETDAQINSLGEYPERCKVVDDSVLNSWGIRYIIVKNYLAFFIIDEEKKEVIIVRFLFQKSNWNAILRQGIALY